MVLLARGLAAQETSAAARKQVVAVRVSNGAIDVNGRLDEPAWTQTPAIADFIQKEPIENAASTEKMEVRFAYDGTGLYVGALMFKAPGSVIQAPMSRRDRYEQAESVLVALDTFHDHRTAYVFGVTASGVRLDRFHAKDDETAFDEGYDPVWAAKTNIDDLGWTAELWIPFSQLRFNAADEHVWGVNVHRFTPTLNEDDYWIPIPRTVTAWASRFGELTGIRGLTSTRGLEVLPYVAGSATLIGDGQPGDPFATGRHAAGRMGADIKMGVGPSLTLDATVNPDFGQVEADPAVVNLTAFETSFAEKRPFFVEGAGLLNLSVATNFFYSRRIGAAPIGPARGDFVDYPDTSTIAAATKLTGRLASGTSVGVLGAVTTEENARVSNIGSTPIASVRVAPRTEYALARVQQEFGRNTSTVSGMITEVHRDFQAGDPLAALLVRNALGVAGDSVLRFKGGEYELISYGGGSFLDGDAAAIATVQRSSAHYGQRPDRHYAPYDPTRTSLSGYRTGATFQKIGGRHWIWSVNGDTQSPWLDSNDMGRLSTSDSSVTTQDIRYRETVPGRFFRGYWIGTRQTNDWNGGGEHDIASSQIYSSQTWNNFWTSVATYTISRRRLDVRLTRGGPTMEVPASWTADFQLKNRASAETSWSADLTIGGTEDGGVTHRLIGHLTLRPGPRLQVSIDPNLLLKQIDSQQYVRTLAGGGSATYGQRYIFGGVDRTTYSMQFRVGYTMKPDVNVDVYAEPFAASGSYSNLGELAAASTRLRRTYGEAAGTTAAKQADGSVLVTDGPSTFRLANNDFNVHSFRSNVVLRWEYRSGSTLYVVWQQDRHTSAPIGARIGLDDPFRSLTAPGNNYLVVKTSFWLPVR